MSQKENQCIRSSVVRSLVLTEYQRNKFLIKLENPEQGHWLEAILPRDFSRRNKKKRGGWGSPREEQSNRKTVSSWKLYREEVGGNNIPKILCLKHLYIETIQKVKLPNFLNRFNERLGVGSLIWGWNTLGMWVSHCYLVISDTFIIHGNLV